MPSMTDLLRRNGVQDPRDADWLHLLVGDWQLLADLSFADLVLWLPRWADDDRSAPPAGFTVAAHCRPTTGATVFYDDIVGQESGPGPRHTLQEAFRTAAIVRESDAVWHAEVPVREETVPVVRGDRVVAVLARHTNLAASRTPSRLELTYLRSADDLALMVAQGAFPLVGAPTGPRRGAPRVGDGLLRLDVDGVVEYASPNALSAFHRLGLVGDLVGRSLPEVTTDLIARRSPVDESLPLVLTGRAPWRTDVESTGTTLSLRAVPLSSAGVRTGALLVLRDVSELRRRERELMTKDATIREIHHRVKNNLQTVAALLRLQARRLGPKEGRAALEEAQRRVATIALVHESLSFGLEERVDFDAVADRGLAMATELASDGGPGQDVRTYRQGSFGELAAQYATPLALVLTELVSNAVGHGLAGRAGTVTVSPTRDGDRLQVTVADDGVGMPDQVREGLGTQIVRTLVSGELGGRITWRSREGGGTEVLLEATVAAASG